MRELEAWLKSVVSSSAAQWQGALSQPLLAFLGLDDVAQAELSAAVAPAVGAQPSAPAPATNIAAGVTDGGARLDLSAAEEAAADDWSLLSWAETAGAHRVLFAALRRAVEAQHGGRYTSEAALAFVRGFKTREAVAAVVNSVQVLDAMVDVTWEAAQKLNAATAATGSKLNDKFAADGGGFNLKYGNLSTFYGGLEGKIGAPSPKSECSKPARARAGTRALKPLLPLSATLGSRRSPGGDGARAHQVGRLARRVHDGQLRCVHDA